jgi:hypothetical protein
MGFYPTDGVIDLTVTNAYDAVYNTRQTLENYSCSKDNLHDWYSLLNETRDLFNVVRDKILEARDVG